MRCRRLRTNNQNGAFAPIGGLGEVVRFWIAALLICFGLPQIVNARPTELAKDPHYNEAGFFDVHICNWPDRPPFVMALFSTLYFDDVEKVSVYTSTGDFLGDLDLKKFRAFKNKEGKPKRAYISQFPIPEKTTDGWYKAVVIMKDGRSLEARDYVIHTLMPFPSGMQPAMDTKDVVLPLELHWDKTPGATHYQIFVYDNWEEKMIYSSPVITETSFKLPPEVLKSGGWYGWKVNARDANENILLGDFNHGTTSSAVNFTVK